MIRRLVRRALLGLAAASLILYSLLILQGLDDIRYWGVDGMAVRRLALGLVLFGATFYALLRTNAFAHGSRTRRKRALAAIPLAAFLVAALLFVVFRQVYAAANAMLGPEPADIQVMAADGGHPRNLTESRADEQDPTWSPDSTRIAYVADRGKRGEIFVMAADGRSRRNLTDSDADEHDPAWSPDGAQIAYVADGGGNQEIYVMTADGRRHRNLTRDDADDANPVWSPDGAQIAFVSYRDGDFAEIYVMAADGSDPRNLTHNDATDFDPAWSPDGAHIAFRSDRDGNWEVYVMDADGGNARNLTQNNAADPAPSWSPDGNVLVLRDNQLEIVPPDGANPQQIAISSGVTASGCCLSPDGARIAVMWYCADNWEIYVMDADGGNLRNVTHDAGGDEYDPVWSPDGRRIAFLSGDKHLKNWPYTTCPG